MQNLIEKLEQIGIVNYKFHVVPVAFGQEFGRFDDVTEKG